MDKRTARRAHRATSAGPAERQATGASPAARPRRQAARLDRALRLGHDVLALRAAPPPRPARVEHGRLGGETRIQRDGEIERLTLHPTFHHGTVGAAESGLAGEGAVWAVNPPLFQADLGFRVTGASRDTNRLRVGLVQNATVERVEAYYTYEHDETTTLARKVTFGPSRALPLLDASENRRPFYDTLSVFELGRPDTDDPVDVRVDDEITLRDRPTFAIPARFERSDRTWTLAPETLTGERTLKIWSRYVDRSGGATNRAELQWSVKPDGSITTAAGAGAPVLDGELASTSALRMTEIGETSEL